MVCDLFVLFFLGYMCLQQVQSSAVSPVYVQSGKDVHLNVSGVPEKFLFFVWSFKTQKLSLILFQPGQKTKPSEKYKGRIHFFDNNNYSVILKNLQQTDSGVYIARVTTDTQNEELTEYNIIVQDPVSPVKLQLDSLSSSSHSCNVTVTCSTPHSHISSTFTCVNNTCDQDGGEQSKVSNSTTSLQVYMANQMVICEHSNQVSRTKNKADIREVCKVKPDTPSPLKDIGIKVGLPVGSILVFIAGFLVVYLGKKRARKKETVENTIYEIPEVATAQSRDQPAACEDASNLSTYSLVGAHSALMRATDSADNPESLYSEIKK